MQGARRRLWHMSLATERAGNAARRGRWNRSWRLIGLGLVVVTTVALYKRHALTDSITSQPSVVETPQQPATASTSVQGTQSPQLNNTSSNSGLQPNKFLAELLDSSTPLKARREKARAVARLGTDEAMATLRGALEQGPSYLKAAIGEALGESAHPDAMALMLEIAHGTDATAARGAIRGLATRGGDESVQELAKVLFDERIDEGVRSEAALGLGDVHEPAALQSLIQAATAWPDETITASVLEALGKRPFAETEAFFQTYIDSPLLSSDAKVAAVEALANASTDAQPLLLTLAQDSAPEVRAAAAWSLIGSDGGPDFSAQLISLLKEEPVPAVRTRLYQALGNQDGMDVSAVITLAEKEKDPGARIAALAVLATACNEGSSSDGLTFFNGTAVPELKKAALSDPVSQDRLASVLVLAQAKTGVSTAALTEIAQAANDVKVVQAANAALQRR